MNQVTLAEGRQSGSLQMPTDKSYPYPTHNSQT